MKNSLRSLRCQRQLLGGQWLPTLASRQGLPLAIRTISTEPSKTTSNSESTELEAVQIPFQGVTHARSVPTSPSYFSRTPQFNDLFLQLSKLLTRYQHLPTVPTSEAPQKPWIKVDTMRQELNESIKASQYTQAMRMAKRLNLIEQSMLPREVAVAIAPFAKSVNPFLNIPNTLTVDRYGRAVGVGRRKASTARAFVVEGTGEVLINGKALNDVFGRVHDRESALWALTATSRMDKYNVWALVEGGGTTGQAEALTLAVAKGLLAHEPALKPALRKGKQNIANTESILCYNYTLLTRILPIQPAALLGI